MASGFIPNVFSNGIDKAKQQTGGITAADTVTQMGEEEAKGWTPRVKHF